MSSGVSKGGGGGYSSRGWAQLTKGPARDKTKNDSYFQRKIFSNFLREKLQALPQNENRTNNTD